MLTLTVSGLHAQDEYPPGTFQLTPQVDLQLQPVPVYVPEPFRDLLPQNPVLPWFSGTTCLVQFSRACSQ